MGERILHAVAVMGVEVDVGDARQARLQQAQDREHRIVEIAEPAGAIGAAVMRPAGRMEGDAAFERELRRADRASDAGRGALEHPGEQRVLHRADAMPLAGRHVDGAGRGRIAQCRDVAGIVEPRELGFGRAGARLVLACVEPVERVAEVDDRFDPRNRQRVHRPVGAPTIDVVADEHRPAPWARRRRSDAAIRVAVCAIPGAGGRCGVAAHRRHPRAGVTSS